MTALLAVNSLLLTAISLEAYRLLQGCSYKPQRGYLKVLVTWYFALLLSLQLAIGLASAFLPYFVTTILLAVGGVVAILVKRKCPLKFTKRIWRMLVVHAVICYLQLQFLCSMPLPILLPLTAVISLLVTLPIDLVIAKYYLKKASKKLRDSNATVIAVTGSYGKTCVKDMLCTLLADSIAPQGNCNTPLGIAKFVNGANLTNCRYLVLEFGARRVGDIKELCRYFPPRYGILTGLCLQHLSTFKSFDNIVKTKGELPKCLPRDGFCLLNGNDDNLQVYHNYGSCQKIFTIRNDVVAEHSIEGTQIDYTQQGQRVTVRLPQISKYVVDTFLLCKTACDLLGQNLDVTLARTKQVKQTPHRMEVSYNGKIWIVDDGYNGNVVGVKNCCDTLSAFPNYKIALTQGIVECGNKRRLLNEKCGQLLGETFDVVIAIGKNAKYLLYGAQKGKCQTAQAKNLDEGVMLLQDYAQPNCIALFQNDLPDLAVL